MSKSRVSNPRTIAYSHFKTPFESSKLPGAGAMFPDVLFEEWPYLYVYLSIYIYIYIYIYMYIYIYLQPDEDLWISNLHWTLGFPGPRWMHAPSLPSRSDNMYYTYVSTHIYICVCVYIYIYTHIHMYMYIFMCIIYIYIYNMYVCMYMCIYMYVYIYIYYPPLSSSSNMDSYSMHVGI